MSQRITTVICDDEELIRRRIVLLARQHTEFDVVGTATNGLEAVAIIEALKPRLALLDIQMPELDGLDVVRELAAPRPHVVFITAFDQYAIRAFDLHALDYLLKPLDPERFASMLRRVAAAETGRSVTGATPGLESLLEENFRMHRALRRLAVRDDRGLRLIDVEEILWIDGADDAVRVHTTERSWIVRKRMSELEARLPERSFSRIHRSTIVNLDWVERILPWSHGELVVVLKQGQHLHASRTHAPALRKLLGNSA